MGAAHRKYVKSTGLATHLGSRCVWVTRSSRHVINFVAGIVRISHSPSVVRCHFHFFPIPIFCSSALHHNVAAASAGRQKPHGRREEVAKAFFVSRQFQSLTPAVVIATFPMPFPLPHVVAGDKTVTTRSYCHKIPMSLLPFSKLICCTARNLFSKFLFFH